MTAQFETSSCLKLLKLGVWSALRCGHESSWDNNATNETLVFCERSDSEDAEPAGLTFDEPLHESFLAPLRSSKRLATWPQNATKSNQGASLGMF